MLFLFGEFLDVSPNFSPKFPAVCSETLILFGDFFDVSPHFSPDFPVVPEDLEEEDPVVVRAHVLAHLEMHAERNINVLFESQVVQHPGAPAHDRGMDEGPAAIG